MIKTVPVCVQAYVRFLDSWSFTDLSDGLDSNGWSDFDRRKRFRLLK